MKSEVISINSNGDGFEEALAAAQEIAEQTAPDEKSRVHIRLLAEETIGMISAFTHEFDALFWMEAAKGKGCRIHLKAYTDMNWKKKNEFLSVAKSGKNEASKGFMGRLRDIMENGKYALDHAGTMANEQGNASLMYGTTGFDDKESSSILSWSLKSFKEQTDTNHDINIHTKQAWDALEKSIVANIADDVRVLVSGDSVELLIEKLF